MLSLDASQRSPQGSPSSFPKWVKPAVFACLALLVMVASVLFGGEAGLVAFGPWANLETLVQENLALSLAVYFLCTVVGCTVLVLPGMVFALAARASWRRRWVRFCRFSSAASSCAMQCGRAPFATPIFVDGFSRRRA